MAGKLQDLRDSLSSLRFLFDQEQSQLAGKIPSMKTIFQTRGGPSPPTSAFTKILSPLSS